MTTDQTIVALRTKYAAFRDEYCKMIGLKREAFQGRVERRIRKSGHTGPLSPQLYTNTAKALLEEQLGGEASYCGRFDC